MSNTLIKGKGFTVHEHGFVRVVDVMGNDAAVVQMARVSYGEGTKTVNEDRGLIRYLMRHRHTSPFEGCVIKLHLKMPIFIARQWVRHRTASMNEYSARYSEMKEEFYTPALGYIQPQSVSNKQGRSGELAPEVKEGFVKECIENSVHDYAAYEKQLEAGVTRELARINLPLNIYTEFYWQMNLHNLLHFCSLRSDPHAQREIRDYSDIILHEIIKEWVPHTYEAFMDYVMNAETFSAKEMELIKAVFSSAEKSSDKFLTQLNENLKEAGVTTREQQEFLKKVDLT